MLLYSPPIIRQISNMYHHICNGFITNSWKSLVIGSNIFLPLLGFLCNVQLWFFFLQDVAVTYLIRTCIQVVRGEGVHLHSTSYTPVSYFRLTCVCPLRRHINTENIEYGCVPSPLPNLTSMGIPKDNNWNHIYLCMTSDYDWRILHSNCYIILLDIFCFKYCCLVFIFSFFATVCSFIEALFFTF